MQHKRPSIPVLVLLGLIIIVGGYFLVTNLSARGDEPLAASGTIEAIEISLAPEIGGKVVEVSVQEGDPVRSGDPLFRLDDTLLQAQRAVASANLDLARAAAQTALRAQEVAESNFTLAFNAARLEAASTRTNDWRAANLDGYTLPGAYFTSNEMMVAAAAEVDAARSAREVARSRLNDLLQDPANAAFLAAEIQLINARATFLVAQDVLTRANPSGNTDLRDSAQAAFDTAQAGLETAQAAYDELNTGAAAAQIPATRADLAAAEERYNLAQDRLLLLQTGIDAPKVAAAQAVLNQAVTAAQQAELTIAQAEASLALIDAQIAKLTVLAPADGVILMRNIQPGEVLPAGATALKLALLDDLHITVYIPEDRYGELAIGQSATVTVDSFPGLTFTATISHIADRAEFTPRNVQTVEGRSSTVYAIRLQVADPQGKLKPGMPADVVFSEQ